MTIELASDSVSEKKRYKEQDTGALLIAAMASTWRSYRLSGGIVRLLGRGAQKRAARCWAARMARPSRFKKTLTLAREHPKMTPSPAGKLTGPRQVQSQISHYVKRRAPCAKPELV